MPSILTNLKFFPTLFIFLFLENIATAQITGGQHVFSFLNLSPSSRVTALGGAMPAVQDEDLAFALENPAALNPKMNNRVSFNHSFYLSDIGYGNFGFGKNLKKANLMVHAALRYIKYGEMVRADEFGIKQGTFKAGETALTLGAARKLNTRFTLGLNLHLANSTFDIYKSSAIAADAGVFYADTARNWTAALVLKNKGAQLSTYSETREDLPFDVRLAFTKRLRYLPFRFGVVVHHLQKWDIRYDDPNAENDEILIFGEENTTKKGNAGIDNFFRHFIFNGEFLFGKTEFLRMRFGYNHLRKQEMTVKNYRSLAGFSGGVGIKVNRFRVDFGLASYHLAGGSVHFGLGMTI